LESKFGDHLKAARLAMTKLAKAFNPKELAEHAYKLYEQFRPAIPQGVKGCGANSDLDLTLIEGLAKERWCRGVFARRPPTDDGVALSEA
jgi:hypothetical protein